MSTQTKPSVRVSISGRSSTGCLLTRVQPGPGSECPVVQIMLTSIWNTVLPAVTVLAALPDPVSGGTSAEAQQSANRLPHSHLLGGRVTPNIAGSEFIYQQ